MAQDNLKTPVEIQGQRIDATTLPDNFPLSYKLQVIQQSTDLGLVAGKANEAAGGAYDAQQKNEEQDQTLSDHETRITDLRIEVDDHELRITANTNAISGIEVRLSTAEGKIVTLSQTVDGLSQTVSNIAGDYVSKSATSQQSLASPLNVTTSYSVGGTKVLGARRTGWTAATGTALRGAFNSDQYPSFSATYQQSELNTLRDMVVIARQRLKALEDDLRAHGVIN